ANSGMLVIHYSIFSALECNFIEDPLRRGDIIRTRWSSDAGYHATRNFFRWIGHRHVDYNHILSISRGNVPNGFALSVRTADEFIFIGASLSSNKVEDAMFA